MNKNEFIEKFKFKSDEDLLEIAINSKSFVFEARYAAATLLKSRNYVTAIIDKVEQEGKELERIEAYKVEKLKQQKQYLIRRIGKSQLEELENIGLKMGMNYKLEDLMKIAFK